MGAREVTPPLPPGFEIERDTSAQDATPALPPGFELEKQTAKDDAAQSLPMGVKPVARDPGRGTVNPPMAGERQPDYPQARDATQGPGAALANVRENTRSRDARLAVPEPMSDAAGAAAAPAQKPLVSVKQLGQDLSSGVDQTKGLVRSAGAFGGAVDFRAMTNAIADFDSIDQGKPPPSATAAMRPYGGGGTTTNALTKAYSEADPDRRQQLRDSAITSLRNDKQFIASSVQKVLEYSAAAEKKTGQMPQFTDTRSITDFANWLLRTGVQGTPTMAAAMIGAAAGPLGFIATTGGMAVGDINQARIEHADKANDPALARPSERAEVAANRDENIAQYLAKNVPTTAALAVPYGGLELLGPVGAALRGSGKALAGQTVKQVLKHGLKETPKQIGEEFGNEGGQEVVNVAGDILAGERGSDLTGQDAKRVFNAGMAGTAVAPAGHAANVGMQAYQAARANGFNVDPPLATDAPAAQREKTNGIFKAAAAQYGIGKEAVQSTLAAADKVALPDLGGFLRRVVGALQTRKLTGARIDPHVLDALDAGPLAPADPATAPLTGDEQEQLDTLTRKAKGTPAETITAPDGTKVKVAALEAEPLTPDEGTAFRKLAERQAAAKADPEPEADGGTVWRNKDTDVPVTLADTPPQTDGKGRKYQAVVGPDGVPSFVPADELVKLPPKPKPAAKADAEAEPDYTGLSETDAPAAEPLAPHRAIDLTTADGEPYGTQAGAQTRATRDNEGGTVVRVQGGWVVRPKPATDTSTGTGTDTSTAAPKETDGEQQPERETVRTGDAAATGASVPGDQRGGSTGGAEGAVRAGTAATPAAADGTAADSTRRGGVPAVSPDAGGRADAVTRAAPAAAVPPTAAGTRVIAQVGTTPKTATPLELRTNDDGSHTPWHEGRELLDFDSGEPVRVPAGATNAQALEAIKAAGSLGKRSKVYGVVADEATTTPAAAGMWKARTAPSATSEEGVSHTPETFRPRPTTLDSTGATAATAKPAKPLGSIKVSRTAVNEATGKTVKIKQRADEALADVQQQISAMEAMLKCLRS